MSSIEQLVQKRLELRSIRSEPVAVPDSDRVVHLQFRRFAGCPVCNLHLRSFARRHGEIVAAKVLEVVVFHSTREELLVHAGDLPFAVIADPGKDLYAAFGVGAAWRALLDPRAWMPVARAVAATAWEILCEGKPTPPVHPGGGRFGLPADFLIGRDGRVAAARYGRHVDDHWSVDEVLALARVRGTPGAGRS